MNADCIFCNIVTGKLPSTTIYADNLVQAFMDISPIVHGHALVIPKHHYETLADAPEEVLARCVAVAKRIARAQGDALDAEGVNLHQANGAVAGQVVPHLHFHVIPRYADDGHHWNWTHCDYDSVEDMAAMGNALKAALPSE